MGLLAFVAAAVAAGLVGAVLHECTHAVTARLLGRRVLGIEWRALNVVYSVPDSGTNWRDYAIGGAPIAVGLAVGLAWVLADGTVSVPLVVGWGVYTVGGIRNDLRMAPEPAAAQS